MTCVTSYVCCSAVLPPDMLHLLPHQLRDLLNWHIQTHGDHLVCTAIRCIVAQQLIV